MEQLNRVELRGNVGTVRIAEVGEKQVINFSMATNYPYKNKDGENVIETTWHNVVAWSGKSMPDFSKITVGSGVHVLGRIRISKYTAGDGTEKQFYEIVASKVELEDQDMHTDGNR